MTTALIIVCIVFCAGIVLAIVSHLGFGIATDKSWRRRTEHHRAVRRRREQAARRSS